MRKLIAAAAVTAGLLISTTTAGASSPTASYSKVKHGTYALCVTNNLGYPYNVAQIQVTGLAKQPTGTAPANWAFSSLQSGSTWVAEWDALDPTLGLAPNDSNCAFVFTQNPDCRSASRRPPHTPSQELDTRERRSSRRSFFSPERTAGRRCTLA
ncbi:MAG: hypothetical protein E6J00_02865 [Chloroflexi bacterium]|nr:MAG: hypothetical protein E6J00_02865 [Chloroflexota bacterium]